MWLLTGSVFVATARTSVLAGFGPSINDHAPGSFCLPAAPPANCESVAPVPSVNVAGVSEAQSMRPVPLALSTTRLPSPPSKQLGEMMSLAAGVHAAKARDALKRLAAHSSASVINGSSRRRLSATDIRPSMARKPARNCSPEKRGRLVGCVRSCTPGFGVHLSPTLRGSNGRPAARTCRKPGFRAVVRVSGHFAETQVGALPLLTVFGVQAVPRHRVAGRPGR